jgi:hypothetical protein
MQCKRRKVKVGCPQPGALLYTERNLFLVNHGPRSAMKGNLVVGNVRYTKFNVYILERTTNWATLYRGPPYARDVRLPARHLLEHLQK